MSCQKCWCRGQARICWCSSTGWQIWTFLPGSYWGTLVSLGHPALSEWIEMDLQVKPAYMEPAQQLKTFCFNVVLVIVFFFKIWIPSWSQQVAETNQARMRSWLSPVLKSRNSAAFDSPEFVPLEDYTSLYFFINSLYKEDFFFSPPEPPERSYSCGIKPKYLFSF